MMKLRAYYDLLANHDWHYNRSDDMRRWRKGDAEAQLIFEHRNDSGCHYRLLQAFYAWLELGGEKPQLPTGAKKSCQ